MEDKLVILQGSHISKIYKSKGRERQALADVSFELRKGEILGIVGESGSGKSTLLRMISGIEKPDEGNVIYKEKDYTGASLRQTGSFLQIIFQDAYGSFDPHLTMRQSLREVGDFTDAQLKKALEKVNLTEDLLGRKPGALSGGQCQRMAICRALLTNTRILLCDEITSALDVSTQAKVVELIDMLNDADGLSIVFVSHDIALVSNICHRVIVMKDGEIVEAGETSDVISNPKSEYTKELISAATMGALE